MQAVPELRLLVPPHSVRLPSSLTCCPVQTEHNYMLQTGIAGDSEVLGVFAKMATVQDPALSKVLAYYYDSELSTLVVRSSTCAQRLKQRLQQKQACLPDILPLDHLPDE